MPQILTSEWQLLIFSDKQWVYMNVSPLKQSVEMYGSNDVITIIL